MSDGLVTLNYLFSAGAAPSCLDAADVNASGSLELTDAIALFDWLFLGGDAPPAPIPSAPEYAPTDCTYELGTDLGCDRSSTMCRLQDFMEFRSLLERVEEVGRDERVIVIEELAPVEEEEAPPEGDEGAPVEGRPIEVLPPLNALPPVKILEPIGRLRPFPAL